jgi:glutamate-1-semialdehyde 2,1-aminomutase
MSALRLARGYTNKNKFIKFEGHYHGHADAFLVSAGSGLATLGIQSAPGLTTGTTQDTLIAKYNDMASVQKLVSENIGEIAAIILEPVAGNMGCVPPNKDFLQSLRNICDEENIVLIFDEVMTGFRLAPGGAQELYGIDADLVTYGKVIGGGMPVGAFGGKREIMSQIAPLGKVYQAGTLSGNPISMTAGITTLKTLKENPSIYKSLTEKTAYLHKGLRNAFCTYEIAATINRVGSMISVHFAEHPVINFKDASSCDIEMFNKYFHFLLKKGVYLPPSAYESWFLNDALSYNDLDKIIKCTEQFAMKNKRG